MTVDWSHQLLRQFDLQWNLDQSGDLTDEEYLWEPVPGCWSLRPTGPGGRGEIEQGWPDPQPAPVTTIAWRLSHLAVGVFGLRVSHRFGDGSLTHENAKRPLTAEAGVAYFTEQALQWRSHVERLDEEGLARPVGEPEATGTARCASTCPACQPGGAPPSGGGVAAAGPLPGDWGRAALPDAAIARWVGDTHCQSGH